MKNIFAAAIAIPLQLFATQSEAQMADPNIVDPADQEATYETYAPSGSYDEDLEVGSAKIMIYELFEDRDHSRHMSLVAHIARLSSEDMSRRLGLSTRPEIITQTVGTEGFDDILGQADVINYSAGLQANMLASITSGSVVDYDMNSAIFVQAVGNHGQSGGALDRGHFDGDVSDIIQFYPYSIQVGEVVEFPNGMTIRDGHSARAGPTLVSRNWTDGRTSFQYMDLDTFNGLDEEVKKEYRVDDQGFFSRIDGTSFTSPDASGALGAAKEAYPQLSNSEHIAALVASAELSESMLQTGQFAFNGDTLPYDPINLGYGVFSPDLYATNLQEMLEINQGGPELQDQAEAVTEFTQEQVTHNGDPYFQHTFEVDENLTGFKATFSMQLPLRTIPADHFIVISPSGQERFIPASIGAGESRFTTEAFLGEQTKGTWQVLTPGESRAAMPTDEGYEALTWAYDPDTQTETNVAATLTLYGQEMGPDGTSTISRFIDKIQETRDLKPVNAGSDADRDVEISPLQQDR